MMALSYRKNARHRNLKKDVRKAVCNKMKRKTKNEMAGWRVHGPEKDGCKGMDRQSKELRGLEAYCRGDQGPPWVIAPSGGGGFSRGGIVSTSPILQAGGPLLVGCPWLLIQFIRSYPPCHRPFLHLQPEDAPCHGERDPLITWLHLTIKEWISVLHGTSLLSRYKQCVPYHVDMTFLQICCRRSGTTFCGAHFFKISFPVIVHFLIYMLGTPIIPVDDIFLLC